jgi:hypothetical protein
MPGLPSFPAGILIYLSRQALASHSCRGEDSWIALRSLSSGAHSRDPLARNDEAIEIKTAVRRIRHIFAASVNWELSNAWHAKHGLTALSLKTRHNLHCIND